MGPQIVAAAMRQTPGGWPGGIRKTKARRMAVHSSSNPTRVGATTVMDSRFCTCGARKMNGYAQASQKTVSSTYTSRRIGPRCYCKGDEAGQGDSPGDSVSDSLSHARLRSAVSGGAEAASISSARPHD